MDQQGFSSGRQTRVPGRLRAPDRREGADEPPGEAPGDAVGAYDERLIVTTALDPCLHAYPVREWEQLEAALATRNPMEPGVKTLMRLYVAPAQECPLDKLGRLLDPARAAQPRGAGEGRGLGGDGEGHRAVEPRTAGRKAQDDARGDGATRQT